MPPVPEPALIPYLAFEDAAAAIDFYVRAFGAIESLRLPMPGGRIGHAEMRIGPSLIMLSDEAPDYGAFSAIHYGGSPIRLLLYVAEVDAFVARAESAGAKIIRPVADQFYGDRSGVLLDPFGYKWTIATHVEDVSEEEMKQRMAKLYG
jgi:PhnB protein